MKKWIVIGIMSLMLLMVSTGYYISWLLDQDQMLHEYMLDVKEGEQT